VLLTFTRGSIKFELNTETTIITKYEDDEVQWQIPVNECSYGFTKMTSIDDFIEKVLMSGDEEIPQSWRDEVQRYLDSFLIE
jgi:hypothetical protein